MNNLTKGMWMGMIGVVTFSLTLPATKLAVPVFGAIPSAFYRSSIAGIIAIIYVWLYKPPVPKLKDVLPLSIIGLLIAFVFPVGIAIAMKDLPSAHGGVVLGLSPLFTAFFATIRFGERPSVAFWLTAIAGSALVVLFSLYQGGGYLQISDIALIIAAVSASYGYAEAGNLAQTMGGKEVVTWAMVLSLVPAIPVSIYFAYQAGWHDFALLDLPYVAISALLFVSIFPAYIGNVYWYSALALGGISHIGQVQLLQPFLTLIFASFLLTESITMTNLGFALVVLIIVVIGKKMRVRRVS